MLVQTWCLNCREQAVGDFAFRAPQTLAEALSLLDEYGDEARPLAGGTNLLLSLRDGRCQPQMVIDLTSLETLAGLTDADGYIRLGALTTVAAVLASPLLSGAAQVLRAAAADFGGPLIRNRATLGGNLVDASPAADMAVPLLALNASVELHSQRYGRRPLALDEFFVAPRQTRRRADELLTAISFPRPAPNTTGGFVKLALRDAMAVAVVSASVVLEWQEDVCRQSRIALGAVAPSPMRARRGEAILTGHRLDSARIAACADTCASEAAPIDDVRGSADYRRRMIAVLVRRLLTRATADAVAQPQGIHHAC